MSGRSSVCPSRCSVKPRINRHGIVDFMGHPAARVPMEACFSMLIIRSSMDLTAGDVSGNDLEGKEFAPARL